MKISKQKIEAIAVTIIVTIFGAILSVVLTPYLNSQPKIEIICLDCIDNTVPVSESPYVPFIPVRLKISTYETIKTKIIAICDDKIIYDEIVEFPAGDSVYTLTVDVNKLPNRNPVSLKIMFGSKTKPLAEKTILLFKGAWSHTTKLDKQIVKKGEDVNVSVTILNHLRSSCDYLLVISLWKVVTLHPKNYDELSRMVMIQHIVVRNVTFEATYTTKINGRRYLNDTGVYYIKTYIIPLNEWKRKVFRERYDIACNELNRRFNKVFGEVSNATRTEILNFCKNNKYGVLSIWMFSDQHKFTFIAVI